MRFADLTDTATRLAATGYLADTSIQVSAFLSALLQRPLLVEGPAGTGKTELGRSMAQAQDLELIRLQCYEGIDETRALYEWEYSKQLLYTQLLRDRLDALVPKDAPLAEAVRALEASESAFFSERFLIARPLLRAIRSPAPCLLLIDEIDKADPEFEALLLEVLGENAVTVPELGTLRGTQVPQVVLTSNSSRELSDALRRRCLHLSLTYPTAERELQIVRARVPDVDDALRRAVVGAVERVRSLDLRKAPSISEVIDWTRALALLGRGVIDEQTLKSTLGLLLKHKDDEALVSQKAGDVVAAAAQASRGTG